MKIGFCGLGHFGQSFADTMLRHPAVEEVIGAETNPQLREKAQDTLKLRRVFATLDELCQSDVDVIAVFSPPWLHAAHSIQALRAGKHVFCAVPAALNLTDLSSVVEAVKSSGRIYMTAETTYYAPDVILCRDLFEQGGFGDIIFSQAAYNYSPEFSSYDFWRRDFYGNFPPMLYATHSTAHVIGTIGSRFTQVSANGATALPVATQNLRRLPEFADNECPNMSAFFGLENGSSSLINEFRNSGDYGGEYWSLFGTQAVFNRNERSKPTLCRGRQVEVLDGLFAPFANAAPFPTTLPEDHPQSPLLRQMPTPRCDDWGSAAHVGSHPFLAHEFITCCIEGKMPLNNVWMAAKYAAPGIAAYESVKAGGALTQVPDFGEPPAHTELFSWR